MSELVAKALMDHKNPDVAHQMIGFQQLSVGHIEMPFLIFPNILLLVLQHYLFHRYQGLTISGVVPMPLDIAVLIVNRRLRDRWRPVWISCAVYPGDLDHIVDTCDCKRSWGLVVAGGNFYTAPQLTLGCREEPLQGALWGCIPDRVISSLRYVNPSTLAPLNALCFVSFPTVFFLTKRDKASVRVVPTPASVEAADHVSSRLSSTKLKTRSNFLRSN